MMDSAGEEAINGPDGSGKKDGDEYDLSAMENAEKNPNEMGDKTENQSPKKEQKQRTGKGLTCEVVLLDGERKTFELDRNAEGRDLFEKVCQHLDLIEKDYFGIQFVDDRISNRLKCWLSPDKKIAKQKKGGPWSFDFALKFYPPDPTQLRESLTRWLVVLQTRRDILSGKLPTTFLTQAMLGSYCVQADVGDFDPNTHKGIEYIRDTSFAPSQTADLLEKIVELHKQHKGQTPDEAEINFLENAKKLSMYGVDLHAAQDANDVDIMLGVCASGLQVYREKLRMSRFVWPKILKICYKRRHFYVKVRPTENLPTENTFSFKLASHRLAKRLWKICVEHHAFFRLREAEQSQNPAMFPRLGSKFRYSGRTLYQTRQSSQILDRPDPYFERSQPARNTFGTPSTRSRSVDELSNRPDYWNDDDEEKRREGQDGKDKKDLKDDPYATATRPGKEDSKLLGSEDGGALEPGANRSMDGRDRLDRKPGEDDATLNREGAEGTMGLTPAELQKAKKDEKERKKREKEEEKRRKKEEEERKKAEKAAKKDKVKDPSAEDRKDALAGKDNTERVPGRTPGSHGDQEGTRFKNRWRSGQDGPGRNQKESGKGGKEAHRDGLQSGTTQDGSGRDGHDSGRLRGKHGLSSDKNRDDEGMLQDANKGSKDGRPTGKDGDRSASDRFNDRRSQDKGRRERNHTSSERDGNREPWGSGKRENRDRHASDTDRDGKHSPWKEGKDYKRLDSGEDRHLREPAAGALSVTGPHSPGQEGQTDADRGKKGTKYAKDKNGKDQDRDADKHKKKDQKEKDGEAGKRSKDDKDKKKRGKDGDMQGREGKDSGRDADRYGKERDHDESDTQTSDSDETVTQSSDSCSSDEREERHFDKHGKGGKDMVKGSKNAAKYGKDGKDKHKKVKDKDADRYSKPRKDKDADRHGKDKDADRHGKDKDADRHGKDKDADRYSKPRKDKDADRHGKDKDADRHGKDRDADKHGKDRDADIHGKHGKDKDADKHGKAKDADRHGKDKDADKHQKDKDSDKHRKDKDADKHGKDKDADKHGRDKDADKHRRDKDADKHGKDKDADKHGKDKDADKHGKDKDADKHGKDKDADKHGKDKDADKHEKDKDADKHGKDRDADKHGKDRDADKHGKDKDADKHGKDRDADRHGKHGKDKHGKDREAGKHGKDRDADKHGKDKDADKHGKDKDADKHGKDKDADKHGKSDKKGGFFSMFKRPRDSKSKVSEDEADSYPGSAAEQDNRGDTGDYPETDYPDTPDGGRTKQLDSDLEHRKDKSKRASLIASLCPGQSPSKKDARKSSVSSDGGNIEASGKAAAAGESQNEQAAGSMYPSFGPGLVMGSGDMSGVVGEETWIDNKVMFEPIVPPQKETKDSLKSGLSGIDHTMPFFSPDATSTVGRPGKVPPPIPPKVNSSFDDSFHRTDVYKNEKDGIQETRVQHKMVLSSADDEDFDYDAALADAIRSVTEFNPDMSVERIECVQQIEDVKSK